MNYEKRSKPTGTGIREFLFLLYILALVLFMMFGFAMIFLGFRL